MSGRYSLTSPRPDKTMIAIELSESQWIGLLQGDEYVKWSHEAATVLFDYYENQAHETGNPYFLDLAEIRSEWVELSENKARQVFNISHWNTEIGLEEHEDVEAVMMVSKGRYLIRQL